MGFLGGGSGSELPAYQLGDLGERYKVHHVVQGETLASWPPRLLVHLQVLKTAVAILVGKTVCAAVPFHVLLS